MIPIEFNQIFMNTRPYQSITHLEVPYHETEEVEVFDYFLTPVYRIDATYCFNSLLQSSILTREAFIVSQSLIISEALRIFSGSRRLNTVERNILELAYKQQLIKNPTLPGRK